LTYLKINRKKNKNSRENRIVSIANKNFKTSFYINPHSEPLEFSSREKRKKQKSKRIVKMLIKVYSFQKKTLKNNKTQKIMIIIIRNIKLWI
jgi:hypothetical protein